MMRILLALLAAAFSHAALAAPQPVTLMLDWYKNPNHAPILLAQARGDYAKAGLAVTILEPADPNDPPKLAAAGKVDIAIGYQPQAMILIGNGVPVARVAALIGSPLNTVMVLADGPVKTLADLKGRKAGYSVSGFEDAILATMLAAKRLSPNDVELINVNFSLAPSLLSGQVDAVVGAFRNYESHQIVLKGKGVRTFPVEAFGVPPYEELVFLTAQSKAKAPAIAKFLAATAGTAKTIKSDPDGAWATIVKAEPEFSNELNRRAFADTAPLFSTQVARTDPAKFKAFADFLFVRKLTRKRISQSEYEP
jgi:putative hydroxymethylpyrimidine transport system substrate-binding protein